MPTTAEGRLHEQYEDHAQQRSAVEQGMWVFLGSEVMLFGAAILAFAIYRSLHQAAFAAASARLHESLGAINTALLLTSSLTMALCAHAARSGMRRRALTLLPVTAAFGIGFLVVKGLEYSLEIRDDLVPGHFPFLGPDTPQQELFFSFYWLLTGLHAVHVTIGIWVMAGLWFALRRRGPSPNAVEATALYWHLVDVIWIFLFPLLYLTGARR
jgi:cytochrome c oxidase subunit 3